MKYFVVAMQWIEWAKAQIKVVVGAFDTFVCAEIFRDAYSRHYSTEAEIVSQYEAFND